MIDFVLNLLPRLKQHSKSLDHLELFVDQPWVVIDEEGNKQQYIFRRDGRLMMSVNGKGQEGKWELIPNAQSLWIDKGEEKLLLNHAFFNKGIMLLRRDGAKASDVLVLANPNVIPDLDVVKYLEQFISLPDFESNGFTKISNEQRKTGQVDDSTSYEFVNHQGISYYIPNASSFEEVLNKPLFHKNEQLPDGTYVTKENRIVRVKNGLIVIAGYLVSYKTEQGKLNIVTDRSRLPKIGNQAFLKTWEDIENLQINFFDDFLYNRYRIKGGEIASMKEYNLLIYGVPVFILLLILMFSST